MNLRCSIGFHRMQIARLDGPIEAWFTIVTRRCAHGCGRTTVGVELSQKVKANT